VLLLRQLVRGAYKGQVASDLNGTALPVDDLTAALAARSLEMARAVGS
jgi:hypothetical protein